MKRFIIMLAAVAVLAFSAQAFAAQGGEGNNTGCNGVGNANSPCAGGAGGNGGNGGNGGQGGAGGSSSSTSSSSSSSKSYSKSNSSSSSTAVGVGIGGDSKANATGGSATATGGSASGYVGGEYTGGSYVGGNQDVHIDTPHQAPTVVAPGLTAAGTGVCLGSVSIGLSGPMAGASFGITKVDKGCELRSNAALLYQFGYKDAAVRLLMKNDDVKEALGDQAPSVKPTAAAASVIQPVQTQPVALTVPAAMEQTQTHRIENVQGN